MRFLARSLRGIFRPLGATHAYDRGGHVNGTSPVPGQIVEVHRPNSTLSDCRQQAPRLVA
jgi:hypothetical protein